MNIPAVILVIFITFCLILILGGSGIETDIEDLKGYRCTLEQLEIVRKETQVCSDATGVKGPCYRSAKISICTKIEA